MRQDLNAVDVGFPSVFQVLSGAHQYGFPSADSDFDVRGVHILPVARLIGFTNGPDTVEIMEGRNDVVSHDLLKFARLALRNNGNVLENLYSPLVLLTTPLHSVLKSTVRQCISRRAASHYAGMAEQQWSFFERRKMLQVKPLLYSYRALLTGIHFMRTGEIDANLPALLDRYEDELSLAFVRPLIAIKLEGPERGTVGESHIAEFGTHAKRLREVLSQSRERSELPPEPPSDATAALEELIVQTRLRALET